MSSLSSIYNSFSEQQKQFVDEKTISATLRIEKWLGFLAKAVKYDHKIDKQAYVLASSGQFHLIAGGDITLMNKGDGAELINLSKVSIKALSDSEIVLIDVPA